MPEVLDQAALDSLLEMVGGDADFVDELVDTFLADVPQQLAELRAAVAAGTAADAVRPAHTLKGTAAKHRRAGGRGDEPLDRGRRPGGQLDGLEAQVGELERALADLETALAGARARRWAAREAALADPGSGHGGNRTICAWRTLMLGDAARSVAKPEGKRLLRAVVDQARQGDEEAFGALVRAVGDRCMFIAHRILRDAGLAEDAVQAALVTVWRELPTLRDLDRFEAWLHRILVNACYAEARRDRRYAANVVLLEMDGPTATDEYTAVHDRDQLDRGFRRLPPEQRAILVFHYALGMTVPEVADHLGIPLGTAKSRLSYATASIRAALEADARSPLLDQEHLA